MPDIEITTLTAKHLRDIERVLAEAFAEHPLTRGLGGASGRYAGAMLGNIAALAMKDKRTIVLGAISGGSLAGVAVIVPGKWEPSRGKVTWSFARLLLKVPLRAFKRAAEWMNGMWRAMRIVEKRDDELELLFLAVRPEMQRRGVGRALVESACGIVSERGLRALRLEAVARTSVVEFYAALGFVCEADIAVDGHIIHVMRKTCARNP